MSFIAAKLSDDTDEQDEELGFALSEERRALCAELAGYRGELINGFAYPARNSAVRGFAFAWRKLTRLCQGKTNDPTRSQEAQNRRQNRL